ncbi:MAG: hypothetical protein ACYDEF_15425 [Methanosarcina sp.]
MKKLKKMKAFYHSLNEKDRRRYAAIEAMKLGHGGQNYISSVLGCHFQTVMVRINEITNGTDIPQIYTDVELICRFAQNYPSNDELIFKLLPY